jgi:serine/threonine-protein kinase
MKTFLPAIVLTNLYILFLICVFTSPAFLPERFATSFNFSGEPECWMSRVSYMMFVSGMGSFNVLCFVVLGFVCRIMPDKWVNVPQRSYWFAPERRGETMNYIFRQMIWYACLLTCFFIGLHFSTVHANKLDPIHLPQGEFITILGGFVAGTLIWLVLFLLHFGRTN